MSSIIIGSSLFREINMSDTKEYPVRLSAHGINGYGATHWTVTLDTSMDGRGRGGLEVRIDVHAQKRGLCIAGNYIPAMKPYTHFKNRQAR